MTIVAVPHRKQEETGKRITTVELIVAERPLPARTRVRTAYEETELRRCEKEAGGIWDAEHKVWRLPKSVIRKLKLIEAPAVCRSKSRCLVNHQGGKQ